MRAAIVGVCLLLVACGPVDDTDERVTATAELTEPKPPPPTGHMSLDTVGEPPIDWDAYYAEHGCEEPGNPEPVPCKPESHPGEPAFID